MPFVRIQVIFLGVCDNTKSLSPQETSMTILIQGRTGTNTGETSLLRKMRAEKLEKEKGKASAQEQAEKEAQIRAKKRGADAMKVKAIKLRKGGSRIGGEGPAGVARRNRSPYGDKIL